MKKRVLAFLCTIGLIFTTSFSSFAAASAATVGPSSYATGDYLGHYDETKRTDPTFINAISGALAELRNEGLNKNSNAIQKAKLVHDYLAKTVSYDYADYDANTVTSENASAYSALVKHTAVCQGYALADSLLMNILGVPTIMVTSNNHAWDMVNLSGKWYNVDVTWDDPRTTRNGVDVGETLRYQYFLKTDDYMKSLQDGVHDTWGISQAGGYTGDLPAADDTTYEFYDFENAQLADLTSFMPTTAATMSLDTTSTYKGTVGYGYTFAVNSNIGEMAFATSTNPGVQVSAPIYASGKQYYTILFKSPCTSTIHVTSASGLTASIPVVVAKGNQDYTCDTSGTVQLKGDKTYTFMITSNHTPKVVIDGNLIDIISSKHSGNHYYYTIKSCAITIFEDGYMGEPIGIYINGRMVPAFVVKQV